MADDTDPVAADAADEVVPTRAEVTATLTAPGGAFEMEEVVIRGRSPPPVRPSRWRP